MKSRSLVPVLVFLCTVVAVVSSLGAPLVPKIAEATDVSLGAAQWSLTISLLVGAVAAPTVGRLGDGPHRRAVVLWVFGVVVAGSVLAALPLSFGWLLLGRAMMGSGLGLTSIAMAAARDELRPERTRSVVAVLSVTAAAGVGLGYPLTGVIVDQLGFRAAFWFGAIVTAIGFLAALFAFPSTQGRPSQRLDWVGALLLGGGVAGVLVSLSESQRWPASTLLAVLAASAIVLVWWVRHELRVDQPLVDLRLVGNRTVLTADATGLFAGIGMYTLMSMMIRFVQTPPELGYGFGASVLVAGLCLLPFSLMSVTASRVAPLIAHRFSQHAVLPAGCLIVIAAELLFVANRQHMWNIYLVMGIAGLGVGTAFAAMPGLIVRSVPPEETGSAMSFNQVLRYVGYSLGSALSATVLSAHTPAGRALPTNDGYTMAALIGAAILLFAAVLSAILPLQGRESEADTMLIEESVVDAVPVGAVR